MSTKNKSDRELMRQALDALENARLEYDYDGNPMDECDADVIAAADALRVALDQHEVTA